MKNKRPYKNDKKYTDEGITNYVLYLDDLEQYLDIHEVEYKKLELKVAELEERLAHKEYVIKSHVEHINKLEKAHETLARQLTQYVYPMANQSQKETMVKQWLEWSFKDE